MKQNNRIILGAVTVLVLLFGSGVLSSLPRGASDTARVREGNRNVMLNAASANAGPREVNIGLPASVGGTTVLENDLPVVCFFWPEFPFRLWRMDVMTSGVKLMDLGQTAIRVGDVGFSVGTYNNLGSDKLSGNGSLNSNHFGLLNGTIGLSGPVGKRALKYAAGAFLNFDPGTYRVNKNHIDRYFSDQTQLYKVAVTKDYTVAHGGTGLISVLYKFADSKSMAMSLYAPFRYFVDGSVEEIDHFKIGRDNYQIGQKIVLQDAFTGEFVERDALKDYGSTSHTLDIAGNNQLTNGLSINYIVRGHRAKSGNYLSVMTGIVPEYKDDKGVVHKEHAQGVMILASRRTPIKSLTSLIEVGKTTGRHDWKIGLNLWLYHIDQFATEGTTYFQSVEANPRRLVGNVGAIFEYHNGTESKTAVFATDKWSVTDLLALNVGVRLEYQALCGDYINLKENSDVKPERGMVATARKTDIKKDWLNKAFMAGAVYKLTGKFGLLGEVTYNEQSGHLENYSQGIDPELQRSHILEASLGVFYNHSLFSLVSKASYIHRNDYRGVVNFTDPGTNNVQRYMAHYDIQTLGWTTDVVASPFNNFSLHALLTIQMPKYRNYTGTVEFGGGRKREFNFNGNIANGVSKVLMELDPSYQWRKLRVWASARYFSKQYANLSNSLTFKGRWESFAGLGYAASKFMDLQIQVVNLLNQRGAQGSISGTDLMTKEEVKDMVKENGLVMSGTYIRPFTVEFAAKFRF